jgi:hypothetical protein
MHNRIGVLIGIEGTTTYILNFGLLSCRMIANLNGFVKEMGICVTCVPGKCAGLCLLMLTIGKPLKSCVKNLWRTGLWSKLLQLPSSSHIW